MKIGFEVAKPQKNSYSYKNARVVYSWDKIQALLKKGYDCMAKDVKTFKAIKLLEKNDTFLTEVKNFRTKFNIPQKPKSKALEKNLIMHRDMAYLENLNLNLMQQEEEFFNNIHKRFNITNLLPQYTLRDLFHVNVISLKYINPSPIYLDIMQGSDYNHPSVNIVINSNNVKLNTVKEFVRKKWPLIKKELNKLNTMKIHDVGNRDLRIYELRKQGNTFNQITNIVSEEFGAGKNDVNMSESVIKTAFQRTEKIISSMFEQKKETPK